jgi:hypothetical protein
MGFIYLAIEDELSEEVGSKIINDMLGGDYVIKALRRGGFGYLKSKVPSFVEMSRQYPVLMVTDLDAEECAVALRAKWFKGLQTPETLIFRVAVREVESWLLADSIEFADYLGVNEAILPKDPDALADPKATLINVARKAKRSLRLDIVPERGALAVQGVGYNRALTQFVRERWDCRRAADRSDSLTRACKRVAALRGQ